MIKMIKRLFSICISGFAFLSLFTLTAEANNISVTNVSLQNQSAANATVEVKFDVTWDNTYSGTDANSASFYDRAWIFVKYSVGGAPSATVGWKHATLTSGGTITPTSDGKGAIVNIGTNQTVKWYYGTDGVAGNATVRVRVCAIEVVYIPTGQFIYNAGGAGGSTYNNYGGGSQSTVSATTNVPTGASTGWPNGYSAFWIAKYEVSQGQYVDFLNMITQAHATIRAYTSAANGNTISYTSGNDYGSRYATTTPNRACNFLSWDDVTGYDTTNTAPGYAAWCAMRPMTEMEFEKAARGGGTTAYTYPWGNSTPSTETYTVDSGTHTKYYANYNNASGAKPINVGHYLSGDVVRTDAETGASPYGVTDMGGNNWEHLINCAATTTPANGDGTTTTPASWPAASSGKGIRGGSWSNSSAVLRVSDRAYGGWTDTGRYYAVGFRPARTAE
jgi:formylglycine-generating enzyme required for sulfatase activity